MAEILDISNGSPCKWIFITASSSGAIREGDVIPNNSPYPQGQTICRKYYPEFMQPFDQDDEVTIQIIHESTNYPLIALELRLSSDDSILATTGFTVLSGNYKNATLDFSEATNGDCVYLRLSSLDISKGNTFGCGDVGDFETVASGWGVSTGLTNSLSRSSTVAHKNTYSCRVTASSIPSAPASEILWCTAGNSVAAEGYHEISGWIYDSSGFSYVQDFEEVYWTIDSGFAGASIISQTRVTPSEDGRGQWHRVSMVFYAVAGALSGTLKLKTGATPQANGILFIDEISLKGADLIEEAYTEPIKVDDLGACYLGVQYSSENPSHRFFYNGSWSNFMRWPITQEGNSYEDPDFQRFQTSAGLNIQTASRLIRIYKAKTDWLPDWFFEKISIALSHQDLLLNGVQFVKAEGGLSPDFPEYHALGTSELTLVDDDYNYQFSLGG